MPKILCRKCNAEFNSMIGFASHICPKERNSPKWGKKTHKTSKETQYLRDFDRNALNS